MIDVARIIIIFNCTLNHQLDSRGYKSDPHPKARKVIQSFIDNEEYIDSYRHLHPDSKAYTYRKVGAELRGRLNYGLMSPSLIQYLKEVTQTQHHCSDVSDHASVSIKIDITNSEQGKGIFKAPPNIHKNTNYIQLIKNTIKNTIYEATNKTQKTELQYSLFNTRIALQEELEAIKTVVPNWKTQERTDTLNNTIATLLSLEPTNEELLQNSLQISTPNLLELTLTKMKEETIKYAKKNKIKSDLTETKLRNDLENLLSQDIDDQNIQQIHTKENELAELEEKKLYDLLSKKQNFLLLEDEKPTRQFLSNESRKSGYHEITRLRIKNPNHNPNIPDSDINFPYLNVTENKQIYSELHHTFQQIYKEQTNLNLKEDALTEYMNSDNDTEPLIELN